MRHRGHVIAKAGAVVISRRTATATATVETLVTRSSSTRTSSHRTAHTPRLLLRASNVDRDPNLSIIHFTTPEPPPITLVCLRACAQIASFALLTHSPSIAYFAALVRHTYQLTSHTRPQYVQLGAKRPAASYHYHSAQRQRPYALCRARQA